MRVSSATTTGPDAAAIAPRGRIAGRRGTHAAPRAGARRRASRPVEQVDPGSEGESEEDQGTAGGEQDVEARHVTPPRPRQSRREQADDGESRERENRTHVHVAYVRERLTPAQAAS